MAASLKILSPGMACSIQDKGRLGYAGFGVPRSGAADPVSLQIGNALVGNEPFESAIEFRFFGPRIEVQKDKCLIGLAGNMRATATIKSTGEIRKLLPWQSVALEAGDILAITNLEDSATGYLTIAGGIKTFPCLGSSSTYARAALGGVTGRNIEAGDILDLQNIQLSGIQERNVSVPIEEKNDTLRIIFGPQDDYFDEETKDRFLSKPFEVTKEIDRMGLRLSGNPTKAILEKGHDLISDGLIPGVIQVPGSGDPIILFVDCQSVGGYPKIATVISADLHKIGQLLPGRKIKFEAVNIDEATRAAASLQLKVKATIDTIQEYFGEGALNIKALYHTNLVSGVVDAKASKE